MNSPETSRLLWSDKSSSNTHATINVRQTTQQLPQTALSSSSASSSTTTTTTSSSGFITLGYRHIGALVIVAVLVGFALAVELNDNSSYKNDQQNPSTSGCTSVFRGNNKDLVIRDTDEDPNSFIFTNSNNMIINDYNNRPEDNDGHAPMSHSSSSWPHIAWLMSFPNSGTSFTLKMIRHVSQRMTASNYGEENRDDDGSSVPVYPNSTDGPFWLEPQRIPKGYDFPSAFVLTKTHCGGRCEKCGPSNYVENPHSFLTQCRSGKRVETDKDGERTYIDVQYDAEVVHRAVHLIRNPFDNIVSRFHLEYHGYIKRNDTQKQGLFPNSREGFRNFCHYLDLKFQVEERHSRFVESNIMNAMQSVPCHGDFFRYVQWHNLAFVTTRDLSVPTYILHYENYEESFNQTVSGLLNFLHLDWENEAPEFIKGKEYSAYFTLEEQEIVKAAMEALSSTTTWNNIYHYFD